jgi:serine/threonine-protein kinase RsbW
MSQEEFQVTISSDPAEGVSVQERIIGMLEKLNFSAKDVFGVRLALEEALVNAIKHGNGSDPTKHVRINCCVDGDVARIEIEDEGPGFSPGEVPDPTNDENLEKPGGRGIMLMRAFMTEVNFVGNGNKVQLVKSRDQEDD